MLHNVKYFSQVPGRATHNKCVRGGVAMQSSQGRVAEESRKVGEESGKSLRKVGEESGKSLGRVAGESGNSLGSVCVESGSVRGEHQSASHPKKDQGLPCFASGKTQQC
jgi:hypothetical protein